MHIIAHIFRFANNWLNHHTLIPSPITNHQPPTTSVSPSFGGLDTQGWEGYPIL